MALFQRELDQPGDKKARSVDHIFLRVTRCQWIVMARPVDMPRFRS